MSRLLLGILLLAAIGATAAQSVEDPMRPPAAGAAGQGGVTQAQAPRWTLHSTLVSPGQRSAVINGRSVGIGERVNGARVLDIQPGSATLRGADGEFVLTLTTPSVKKQAAP